MSPTAVKNASRPKRKRMVKVIAVQPDEIMAQCPECKSMETLFFVDGQLIRNRKFYNEGRYIYHTCGSSQPCRLFRTV